MEVCVTTGGVGCVARARECLATTIAVTKEKRRVQRKIGKRKSEYGICKRFSACVRFEVSHALDSNIVSLRRGDWFITSGAHRLLG